MEQKLVLTGHPNYCTMGKILTLIICSLFLVDLSTGHIKLIDNGYERVLIQIQDTVPESQCQSVFRGIEATMTRASSVLYRATHQRIYFKNVTVIVPQTWSGSSCPRQLVEGATPTDKSDFIVGDPHPVFLHNPWTLQEKGCGLPGYQIYMTPEFLSMRNHSSRMIGDPGRLIVHEWAKYRWGVFEEHGHQGDPIYPAFSHVAPNSFEPTGCSNIPVKGTTDSCSADGKNCHFTPDISQNDNVTSSLMYLHYLPRVTEFCDSHTHDSTHQTKHNVLCDRKSVWEVIAQHEDFIIGRPGNPTKDVTPVFNFVRPSLRRFVIAIEVTAVMNVQKRWDFLRKAVRKFLVYDIPSGHEVAIVLFDDSAWVQKPLAVVPDSAEQRWRLASGSLPRSPSQKPHSQKCIICGLKKAKKILDEENDNAGGVIILISSGSTPQISSSAMEFVEEIRKSGKIQIVPIMYPVTSVSSISSPGIEYLAEATHTRTFTVLDEGMGTDSKIFMMASLMNALYSSLRIFFPSNNDLPALIHQKEHPGGMSKIAEGAFDLDQSLGGELKIVITYFNWGHVGDDITLIDPSGTKLNAPDYQDEDAGVNILFFTFRNAKAGRWRYGIENRANSHQGLYVDVLATPSNRNFSGNTRRNLISNSSVALSAWTNYANNSANIETNDTSLIIYAKLWSGMRPVIGARIEAVLQRLGFNSSRTAYHPERVMLYDNGNGDPDITRGDGIYSRYIPKLSNSAARFTITVEVTDKNNRVSIIYPSIQESFSWRNSRESLLTNYRKRRAAAYGIGGPTCCGSSIPHSRTVDAGYLSRIVSIGIFNLNGQYAEPSRIGDFRASVNPATLHATFYWTAPGNYKDHGTAATYEIVFSSSIISTSKGKGEVIHKWPQPLQAGTASQYTIRWLRHDTVYYVAIRAIGSTGKFGSWSNTAYLYVPPPATTTEINTRGSTTAENTGETIGELGPRIGSKNYFLSNNILAIIIASCILLLIILIMSFYLLMIVTRRKAQRERNTKSMLDGSVVAAITTDKDDEADSINKEPPEQPPSLPDTPNGIPRSLSPIQSWPASKLLEEHERRRSTDPAYGETPDLGVPYHPSVFYYHRPNGGYIEDTIPIDSGSMISSHPSESFTAYKIDNHIMDNMTPVLHHAATPVSWDGINRPKIPPATLPKPSIPAPKEFSPHVSAINDNKRRTITQV